MLDKFMNWLGYEKIKVSVSEYTAYMLIKDLQDTLTKLPLEGVDAESPVLRVPVGILTMCNTFENNLLAGKYTVTLK